MDFDGVKQQIRVNNREEYLRLIPLLNQIFKGWSENHVKEDFPRYIALGDSGRDSNMTTPWDHKEIIDASEYLAPPEVLIFN